MRISAIKFIVAGLVVVSAVAYLAYAGLSEGWVSYHLQVDEFTGDTKYHAQRVRLCGKVATEGLEFSSGRLMADFTLQGAATSVKVQYKGAVPDLFKAGAEAVVEGRLGSDGVFRADLLMTKCASKYEEADGAANHGKDQKKPENHPA